MADPPGNYSIYDPSTVTAIATVAIVAINMIGSVLLQLIRAAYKYPPMNGVQYVRVNEDGGRTVRGPVTADATNGDTLSGPVP